MNAGRPEIVATQHGSGSAEVTVRAMDLTAYRGTCELHNRPVRYDHGTDLGPQASIPCPDGAHEILGRRLICVQSNVTCDGACWSAVSDRCICGCGGLNHGRAWMIASAFASMSPEDLTEAWRGARTGSREVFEDELANWRATRVNATQAATERRERRKATEQRRAKVTFEDWAKEHANVIDALRPWAGGSNPFLADLALQVTTGRNGTPKPLTESQIDAARRAIGYEQRQARIAAERETAKRSVPAGRTTITGRVVKVSYRSRDSRGDLYQWGPQHRMTVSCDGYAVQVPVPAAVGQWARANRREQLHNGWRPDDDDYTIAARWTDALKGLRVTLTTTVARSDRDPSFGFGKGASGVRISEPDREMEAGA